MSSPIHRDELPREKLLKNGVSTLSDYELLAIVLNTGTKKENVLDRYFEKNKLKKCFGIIKKNNFKLLTKRNLFKNSLFINKGARDWRGKSM